MAPRLLARTLRCTLLVFGLLLAVWTSSAHACPPCDSPGMDEPALAAAALGHCDGASSAPAWRVPTSLDTLPQATLASFPSNAGSRAGTVDVAISGFAFHSADLTVEEGTTVRWTNFDGASHSATSMTGPGTLTPSGVFDSGLLDPGSSYQFTFTSTGDYYYYCVPHGSSMQAVVHVVPVPEPAAGAALAIAFAAMTAAGRRVRRGRGATPHESSR